jgi:hypothetical protein
MAGNQSERDQQDKDNPRHDDHFKVNGDVIPENRNDELM